MRHFQIVILLLLTNLLPVIFTVQAQTTPLNTVYQRQLLSLNGYWKYIVDPYENGYYNYRYQPYDSVSPKAKAAFFNNAKPDNKSELLEYNFDTSDSILVPGDWNTQKEKLFYYEGTLWYKKSFSYSITQNKRVFLHFGAANYKAEVYLNGTKLGTHVGGFTPFNFEITHLLKATDNFVVVKVDNKRLKDGVPTLNTDWWNYGGITRDVSIVEVSETFISDFSIQTDANQNLLGYFQVTGEFQKNSQLQLLIPELKIKSALPVPADGKVSFQLPTKKLQLWSPESPKLYKVQIIYNKDTLTDEVGFKTITTQGTKILLNGKEQFLRGICIHEENALRGGRAYSEEDATQLLTWAKELGCNYVRLAHYPHNEYMVRLADKMGIMVWEEVPVYWTIQWQNEATYRNAEQQLTEMIQRDKNRASVIIWSMANETPNSEARFQFLKQMVQKAKSIDSTRLVSAALEQSSIPGEPDVRTITDPFADWVDVLSFNQYIGWYEGLPDKCQKISWKITQNKPVLISEFGADALQGFFADSLTRWSEDYQAYLYTETLKMISGIPQLAGFSPWILVDFRSPRRVLPGIQDGWNRKGVIGSNGKKKKAYDILQQYYKQKSTF